MAHAHTEYVDGCFACKLRTLSFGEVPGAYRQSNSRSYYDKDSLRDQGFNFSKEEVQDTRSDFNRAVGDWE